MSGGFRKVMRGEADIDFVGRSKLWALISAAVVGISLIGIFVVKLNLGLEFEGGTALSVTLENDATIAQIQDALGDLGDTDVQIVTNRGSGEREVLVRTRETGEEKLAKAQRDLAKVTGNLGRSGEPNPDAVSRTTVGPSWGAQVSSRMLRALVVFLLLVTFYISMRFEPKMAAGALLALFHDLIATAGIYALIGFEVTPATVIALLTLMGFSLYDTVVVFDRVRENAATLTGAGRVTYSEMVNRSVNEVLIRSINTSLSSVLPVAGLLFVGVFLFGAVTLKDLALAMFVGTLVSTYSSIFVATPVLAFLKEREPRYRAMRERAAGAEARPVSVRTAAAATATATAGAPLGESPRSAAAAPDAAPSSRPAAGVSPRSAPRPRKRRRGKRR